jgi:hypothetical protein
LERALQQRCICRAPRPGASSHLLPSRGGSGCQCGPRLSSGCQAALESRDLPHRSAGFWSLQLLPGLLPQDGWSPAPPPDTAPDTNSCPGTLPSLNPARGCYTPSTDRAHGSRKGCAQPPRPPPPRRPPAWPPPGCSHKALPPPPKKPRLKSRASEPLDPVPRITYIYLHFLCNALQVSLLEPFGMGLKIARLIPYPPCPCGTRTQRFDTLFESGGGGGAGGVEMPCTRRVGLVSSARGSLQAGTRLKPP